MNHADLADRTAPSAPNPHTARYRGMLRVAKKAVRAVVPQRLIEAVHPSPGPFSMHAALRRCRRRGVPLRTVIDVGASNGSWSAKAMEEFPSAHYLLIEAQSVHESALRNFSCKHGNVEYIMAAAGQRVGELYFDDGDPFGGVASETRAKPNYVQLPATTIDHVVEQRRLSGPFALKLDTHGFEVPIFEGALRTLRETQLIVVETYNFSLTPDSLRFHEMCAYLEQRGFRCVDLADPLHRPKDRALWQMDLFFVPASRSEFRSSVFE